MCLDKQMKSAGTIVIGITDRAQDLDKAILRYEIYTFIDFTLVNTVKSGVVDWSTIQF